MSRDLLIPIRRKTETAGHLAWNSSYEFETVRTDSKPDAGEFRRKFGCGFAYRTGK